MKKFTAKIQHKPEDGGAWVQVPFDVKAEFGSLRLKVKAVFDGKLEYRGSLVRMGDEGHVLGVRKDIRNQLGKMPGDEVQVEITKDTEARVAEIPEILAKALNKNKEAKRVFDKMSYSHQKEYTAYITEAKKEETRQRRVLKTMEMLVQNKTP